MDVDGATPFYAPLTCFRWYGGDFDLTDGIAIRRLEAAPYPESQEHFQKLAGLHVDLAMQQAEHWLVWHSADDQLNEEEIPNIFLIALWIAIPTETHIRLTLGATPRVVHSTFMSAKPHIEHFIEDKHLVAARSYFLPLLGISQTNGRLHNSFFLTYAGSIQFKWQVSLMCFMAALESLLIHARKRGSGDHIADAFSKLTEVDIGRRREARKLIGSLYKVRSDLQHGKGSIHDDPAVNVTRVAELRDALRATWREILTRPGAIQAFDGDDGARAQFFATLG